MHGAAAVVRGQFGGRDAGGEGDAGLEMQFGGERAQLRGAGFVVRADCRAEDDHAHAPRHLRDRAQQGGVIFHPRNPARAEDQIVIGGGRFGGAEARRVDALADDGEFVFPVRVSARQAGHHAVREAVAELQRQAELRVRVPGDEGDALRAQHGPGEHGENLDHVREAAVDAPGAEDAKKMPVEFERAARFRMAEFRADGMDADVRRHVDFTGAHRDHVDRLDARGELADPLGGEAEDRVLHVGHEIEKEQSFREGGGRLDPGDAPPDGGLRGRVRGRVELRADVFARGVSHPAAQLRRVDQGGEFFRNSLGRAHRDDESGRALRNRFVGPADRGGHDRQSRGRRFHEHARVAFVIRREDENIGLGKGSANPLARHLAAELHERLQALALHGGLQRPGIRAFADEREHEGRPATRAEELHRFEEHPEVFLRGEPPDEEQPHRRSGRTGRALDLQKTAEVHGNDRLHRDALGCVARRDQPAGGELPIDLQAAALPHDPARERREGAV